MAGWDYVKNFYKENFGIEEWVVELYANLDILQLCASGASIKTIAEFCELDLDDVVEILMNTFKFPGWLENLEVNPYKLYLDLLEFNEEERADGLFVESLNTVANPDPKLMLQVCKTMKEIEERIADEWV